MEMQVIKTANVKYLQCSLGVRHWEDSEINGEEDDCSDPKMPQVEGGRWCPVIDIDEGKILYWDSNVEANIHYKVCDDCKIECFEEDWTYVCNNDGFFYCPDFLCPEESGYGDYVIMHVLKDGTIANFDKENVRVWVYKCLGISFLLED